MSGTALQRKHPAGLPFLFLSEVWERFGYYLMIGIFQLYLADPLSKGERFLVSDRPSFLSAL